MLELQVGAAKVGKYATPESGDTLEIFESPKHPYTAQLIALSTRRHAAPVGANGAFPSEASRPGAAR